MAKEGKKGSKLKVVLIVVVVLIIAVFALGSSGDGESDSSSAGSSSSSSASTATVSTSEDAEDALEEVEFEEVTVVDNDYLTITLTDLEVGSSTVTVDVTLVNKDESITYMVATDAGCSIDGVQVDPLYADEVAGGKTANSTITISIDDLADAGVAFTDIYLAFYAYDSDDWSAGYVVDGEGVHLYPYGEDAATTFVRESAETDLVLVDNDEVTVTVLDFDPDYFWGYGIDLYIENKTSSEIMVSTDDDSINGVMCDAYWAASVEAGLCSFETLYWFSSTLEDDLGITDPESEIEEIEFALNVYDTSTFDYYVDALTVTLEP